MVLHADRGGLGGPGADQPAASPGFTWGKSGKVGPSIIYLLNDTVPSNITGRLVPIDDAIIAEVFVSNELNNTFIIAVEKRVGAVFVELLTISLIAQRTKIQSFAVSVTRGDELAVKLKSGSAKNPVVGVIIKGDTI